MVNSFAASRAAVVYALVLPVAVLVGFFLADPTAYGSIAIFLIIGGVLAVPILMRWHHPLLILSWNAAINPFFLPGRPYLWMLMSGCSLFFAIVDRTVDPDRKLSQVPSLTKPLLFLLVVVLATGLMRGGFGSQALGSQTYGGKGYYYIVAAVAGYFALSTQRIPVERAGILTGLFFLSGVTALIPNITYAIGSGTSFLFYLFPPEYAMEQAASDYSLVSGIFRIFGLSVASTALYCWVVANYGLGNVLTIHRPWRMGIFLLAWLGCAFCGFRSFLVQFFMLFVIQFWVEGLFRTRILPVLLGLGLVTGALVIHQSDQMPLVVQRTLSFLPIKVSPLARESADSSLEWRLEMWNIMMPEIPRYLLLGKGYGVDATDIAINSQRGINNTLDTAIQGGDYHSGPLSLIIPFGIWGVLAVLWFWTALFRYLLWNYRQGHSDLARINTFLLVLFIVKVLFFLFVFGGFYADIYVFAGIAGLSVSLNGPLTREREAAVVEEPDVWAMAPRRT